MKSIKRNDKKNGIIKIQKRKKERGVFGLFFYTVVPVQLASSGPVHVPVEQCVQSSVDKREILLNVTCFECPLDSYQFTPCANTKLKLDIPESVVLYAKSVSS